MRIALIAGKEPSRFDRELLKDIESIEVPLDATPSESYLIGIRDEHGDIYRTINVSGRSNAIYLIETLRHLGYPDEAPNSYETELGVDTVISVVKTGK